MGVGRGREGEGEGEEGGMGELGLAPITIDGRHPPKLGFAMSASQLRSMSGNSGGGGGWLLGRVRTGGVCSAGVIPHLPNGFAGVSSCAVHLPASQVG